MPEIVLSTLNARYSHAAFGLRYLMANLPAELIPRAGIVEFDINQRPIDIVEKILDQNPKIVGLGIYIWNVEPSLEVVAQIKRIRPEILVIVGGPEVSYETDQQEICRLADYTLCGEADIAFGELCGQLFNGRRPLMKVMQATLPEFPKEGSGFGVQGSEVKAQGSGFGVQGSVNADHATSKTHTALPHVNPTPEPRYPKPDLNPEPRPLNPPYALYTDHDLAHRVIYVEASRGCPFKCEFCLSSLDVPLRNAPVDGFLAEMQKLLDRGLRQFKFVDRTFNLNLNISTKILRFFLDRYSPGLFLHFEMIPDRLPEQLRELIAQFPPGALQFEVGIQTFNPEVEKLISRRQDHAKLEDNLRWLRERTGVHVHTDLIVGLPGEDLDSFARGFDKLLSLRPQEIQVGILKRLRGTPIVRHDAEWGMIYSPHAPYEILQTKLIDFNTMQRMRRFARYWDLVANSGNFVATTERLLTPSLSTLGEDRGEGRLLPPLPLGEGRGEGACRTREPLTNQQPFSQERPLTLTLSQRERGSENSAFTNFLHFSDWLYATTNQTHAISLTNLAELIFRFCTEVQQQPPALIAQTIWADFQRVGRSDRPDFLKPFVAPADTRIVRKPAPSRQARHLGSS